MKKIFTRIVVIVLAIMLGCLVVACEKKESWGRPPSSPPALPSDTIPADGPDLGDDEPNIGDEEPGTGDEEPGTGDEEPGVGDEEPGTGDEEPGTGDEEPGAGDEEPGTGDEEPGTGDEEPGTGDEEPGPDGEDEPDSPDPDDEEDPSEQSFLLDDPNDNEANWQNAQAVIFEKDSSNSSYCPYDIDCLVFYADGAYYLSIIVYDDYLFTKNQNFGDFVSLIVNENIILANYIGRVDTDFENGYEVVSRYEGELDKKGQGIMWEIKLKVEAAYSDAITISVNSNSTTKLKCAIVEGVCAPQINTED